MKKVVFHILPEDGRLIEFSLSYRALKVIGIFLFVLLLGVGYLGWQYGRIYVRAAKVAMLEKENRQLKKEVEKIKLLERKLREFEILSKKLASALEIDISPDWEKTMNTFKVKIEPEESLKSVQKMGPEEIEQYIPNISPVKEGWISKGFSKDHPAVDFSAPPGTPIYSPMTGVVVFSGYDTYFGYMLKIENDQGFTVILGHNKQNLVGTGKHVKKGELVALLGNTGHSTAPHLHYEVLMHGRHIDPLTYLPERR